MKTLIIFFLCFSCFYSSIFSQIDGLPANNLGLDPEPSEKTELIISTYLGNENRNYYGNQAPSKLDTIWKLYLGEGISPAYGNNRKVWKGAGWTGQPLYIREGNEAFLILGAFDYNLKKINALTGKIVWQYEFDDIIKGTATIWHNSKAKNKENEYVILQGSRLGYGNSINDKIIPSYRAVSYQTGNELWRLNMKKTDCYSRDVDGSALVWNDTAYLAFENGIFTVFSPDAKKAKMNDGIFQPAVYQEIKYYNKKDIKTHGNDLVSESSPTLLENRIYTPSGSGWVYGYNIDTKKTDWKFFIGSDMNGSAPVTNDSCLLVAVEKQYINGKGGVFKLNPAKKPQKSVVWYFPTDNLKWFHWEGGIVGSVAVNDAYINENDLHLAAFVGVDGYLNVVNHRKTDENKTVLGPNAKKKYSTPKLIFKQYVGGTISSPIFVKDKLIVALDNGLLLYEYDEKGHFKLLDKIPELEIDATPIAVDGRIYIASRNGYLYCLGEKNK